MFKDEHRRNVWDALRQHDLSVFAGRLSSRLLTEAAEAAGVRVGKGPLYVVNLAWLAVAAAMQSSKSFADVLTTTLKLLSDVEGFGSTTLGRERNNAKRRKPKTGRSRHDPRRHDPTEVSEEAFTKARRLLSVDYWRSLFDLLGKKFEAAHGELIHWKGFRVLAMDGTSITLPRWKRLAKAFGTASNGKAKKKRPQARMVMLEFPLARIPYRYELSPKKVGEKTLAARLIEHLMPNDMLLLDRGFWSYGLFWKIQNRDAFFGIRQFKTAKFKTLRRLGPKDRLVRYAPTGRQWRKQRLPESIDLRIITYQISGFRPTAVVTNALDPEVTTREDWVRLTGECDRQRGLLPGLYHRRWEIETTFHELKIAQALKTGLRSRTLEGIQYEVAGHVLFYLLVRWMMVEAAKAHDHDPLRLSFTHALRELRDMHQALTTASPQRVSQVLLPRLMARLARHLVPERPGRNYSRPHDTKVRTNGAGKRMLPSKLPTKKPPRSKRIKKVA